MSILGNFRSSFRAVWRTWRICGNVYFATSQNINPRNSIPLRGYFYMTERRGEKKTFIHHVHVSDERQRRRATWSAGFCVVIELSLHDSQLSNDPYKCVIKLNNPYRWGNKPLNILTQPFHPTMKPFPFCAFLSLSLSPDSTLHFPR